MNYLIIMIVFLSRILVVIKSMTIPKEKDNFVIRTYPNVVLPTLFPSSRISSREMPDTKISNLHGYSCCHSALVQSVCCFKEQRKYISAKWDFCNYSITYIYMRTGLAKRGACLTL